MAAGSYFEINFSYYWEGERGQAGTSWLDLISIVNDVMSSPSHFLSQMVLLQGRGETELRGIGLFVVRISSCGLFLLDPVPAWVTLVDVMSVTRPFQ